MAFRVPLHAAPSNRGRAAYAQPDQQLSSELLAAESLRQQEEDDNREWVLFSPSQAAFTSQSRSDFTELTPKTPGVSRLSDFGSFNARTHSRDGEIDEDEHDEILEDGVTEADSLDDGLQAFRGNHLSTQRDTSDLDQSHTVLPAHDGLGSFHTSGQLVQEHMLRHELNNRRRTASPVQARSLSVQRHLDTVDEMEIDDAERERWNRIEQWRLEQSKLLLQEIEKETKRRQRRGSRVSHATSEKASQLGEAEAMEDIARTISQETSGTSSASSASTLIQDGDDTNEPLWRRITRKVIRDLIGIDDTILSVILGESFIEAPGTSSSDKPDSMDSPSHIQSILSDRDIASTRAIMSRPDSWQDRLLQRIARELGVLVHQIFEQPGILNAPLLPSDRPTDYYAGIPVSRRTNDITSTTAASSSSPHLFNSTVDPLSASQALHFAPTLPEPTTAEHAAEWGIEEHTTGVRMNPEAPAPEDPSSESGHLQREHEYWEHELDIMMVFRYLRNRFRRSHSGNSGNGAPSSTNRRGSNGSISVSQQDGFSRRAAVIRQHHPLVARAHAQQSQHQHRFHLHYAQGHNHGVALSPTSTSSPIVRHRFSRRPSSSCASQSTKISNARRATLGGLGSGSSRNYWDIGGSVGSGSAVHSLGGMGAWGEA